jgi:hypothetical protein
VNWEDPSSGLTFYDLGRKNYSPFSYMVIGTLALLTGIGAFALILGHHQPVAVALIPLILFGGIGVFTLRMGINLSIYDRKHGFCYGGRSVIARYQKALADGRTPAQALAALKRRQIVVTLIGTAAVVALGVGYYFATR